jgi:hypothetical protein
LFSFIPESQLKTIETPSNEKSIDCHSLFKPVIRSYSPIKRKRNNQGKFQQLQNLLASKQGKRSC